MKKSLIVILAVLLSACSAMREVANGPSLNDMRLKRELQDSKACTDMAEDLHRLVGADIVATYRSCRGR